MDTLKTSDFPDQTDIMILPWVCLFPGALLPLYIFEQRYRDMTTQALAGNRMFAIAHSYDDTNVATVAGLGIIRACVSNPDGTLNLILQGLSRVELSDVQITPRPRADVRILRDDNEANDLTEMRSRILRTCQELLSDGQETPPNFESYLQSSISDSAFTDLIASTLISDPSHRRALFETVELDSRMALLLEMLSLAAESA